MVRAACPRPKFKTQHPILLSNIVHMVECGFPGNQTSFFWGEGRVWMQHLKAPRKVAGRKLGIILTSLEAEKQVVSFGDVKEIEGHILAPQTGL